MLFIFIISALSIDSVGSIKKQISSGKYDAAYQASNSMILKQGTLDADSILFFLRGYSSVKVGKYSQAVSDISRFLRTNIDNQQDKSKAYALRGTAYLKLGNLEDAKNDADASKDDNLIKLVRKANFLLNSAQSNESTLQFALNKYLELIKICSSSPDYLREAAQISLQLGNNTLFIELSQKVFNISPSDAKMLELKGRYHFSNAEITMAQKFAKMCINSASDASKCTGMIKSINSFQANEKNATSAIAKKDYKKAQKHIDICKNIVKEYSTSDSLLSNRIKAINVKILLANNKKDEAVEYLNDLIKASPNNIVLLTQRGELLLDLGDYTGALADFQIVKKNTKPNTNENKKVIKLIEKASELQEKEKNVDYYTVLGLKHGAPMKDVKSAYRKMVVKWHPDRFKEPLKKKEAEKKMKMINRAYDVLSDEKKKQMYDLGQDPDNQIPNDPPPNSGSSGFHNFGSKGGGKTFYTKKVFTNGNTEHFSSENFQGFGGFSHFDFFKDIINDAMGFNMHMHSSNQRTSKNTKSKQKNTNRK